MNRTLRAVDGSTVAATFHRDDKEIAIDIWRDVTRRAGVADKVLAAECGMSRGYYSKVANGEQGDLLALVYRVGVHRPELRRQFVMRLAEQETADSITAAAEQLAAAALRFVALNGEARGRRIVQQVGR